MKFVLLCLFALFSVTLIRCQEVACCEAITAECVACSQNQTVPDFCRSCLKDSTILGCSDCQSNNLTTECLIRNFYAPRLRGSYVPQCDELGAFVPRQCHGSTGMCWCVTDDGKEIPGTRNHPGHHHATCHSHPNLTSCQVDAMKSEKVGAFTPKCKLSGDFEPLQCHGSTGMCWCVTDDGKEVPGTRTEPGHHHPTCVSHPHLTTCERSALSALEGGLIGAYVPQCEKDGDFNPRQCHASTGECWCVNTEGHEIEGTRVTAGNPIPKCHKRKMTQCETIRAELTAKPSLGKLVPKCEPNGDYSPMQCNGSTGYCWCVNKKGEIKQGTETKPGEPQPVCSKKE